jgi:hypothetical protein
LVQILAEALAAEAVGELLKRGRNSKVYECTVWLRWKSAVYQDQVVASAGRGRGRMNLKILDSAHYGEELPGAATRADPMDPLVSRCPARDELPVVQALHRRRPAPSLSELSTLRGFKL